MNKFFKYTLINIGIPVILYFAVLLLPQVKIPGNMLQHVYTGDIDNTNWVDHFDSVYGVILGSSTLKYGVSCNEIKRNNETWVNLSMDARDPVMFYFILERLFAHQKPKVVLVGLDPWIYSKRYYRYRNPIMYFDLTPSERIRYFIDQDKSMPKKMYKDVLSFLYFKIHPPENKPFTAGQLLPIPEDNGSVKLKLRSINFEEVKDDEYEIDKYGWSVIEFEYLEKIVQICKDNNTRLVFIFPPKRNDYIYWVHKKFNQEYTAWWTKVCTAIPGAMIAGNGSDLANYSQDSVFQEAYHLNTAGQQIYSKILRAEIDSPSTISTNYSLFK